jgi:hypothetical protein
MELLSIISQEDTAVSTSIKIKEKHPTKAQVMAFL